VVGGGGFPGYPGKLTVVRENRHALPRLAIAAPASGHGKTTIATGLMAALRRTGLVVSGHKVGPDYIDPGYHALATGRPGRNLDPHLVGVHRLVPLLLHGAHGADLAVVEGVMGLYDGHLGRSGYSSTAHVAAVTQTPVVLVVDISHASRSVGALVHGLATWPAGISGVVRDEMAPGSESEGPFPLGLPPHIAGVILNKAGSERHAKEAASAIDLPVLGVLHRDDGIAAPSRHLGLVPAEERDEAQATLDRLADRIADRIDLAQILDLARTAPDLAGDPWRPEVTPPDPMPPSDRRPVVAMAGGRAFTFRYAETEELLRAAGCDVVTFDPLTDNALPPGTAGIYLGGGFPEVHAAELAASAGLRADLLAAIRAGIPTVAECAGLLYLCEYVDGVPMVGALPASARMTERLTLAYRDVAAPVDTLLTRAGERVTGHEFHRTQVTPAAGETAAWSPAWTVGEAPFGYAGPTLHASYLHTHWAGHPQLAQRFADAVHATTPHVSAAPAPTAATATETAHATADESAPADPLRHHGDVEVRGERLLDFAVNVYDAPRPPWLVDALRASLDDIGDYPDPTAAEEAIAARHGRPRDQVLATAGAAEAFGLIARLRNWRRPVVCHPQFTEPDVALAEAGHRPEHVLCRPDDGFALDPDRVPDDADLVMIGNPTNPTGVLHPADTIRKLLRADRLVVVDEAFLDFLPDEPHSLAQTSSAEYDAPGLVVIRSLTKLWSIPGVRAGYLLADAPLVADLRAAQTPWSVSATAAAAMIACYSPEARAEKDRRATQTVTDRANLVAGLDRLGVETVAGPAPFVLARVGAGVRESLRTEGIAVRRADTFPGLGPEWVRIAVRGPAKTATLLEALAQHLG